MYQAPVQVTESLVNKAGAKAYTLSYGWRGAENRQINRNIIMAGKKCSEGRQRNETIRELTQFPFARQLGEHRVSLLLGVLAVPRGLQILCFFSCLAIVTRSIDIDFQRECVFSLSSLVSHPAPFPSCPAKEVLVLLTEFMHHFGLKYRK